MNKNTFKKYNTGNTLLVISGFPKRKERYSQGVCAVSSFTKNSLDALRAQNPDRKIVVLTMVIGKQEVYEEDGMLIVRCFKRNSPLSYIGLLKQVLRFNKAKNVMLEFEFASFGNTLATGLLVPLVWTIKLFGKDITLVSHQVLDNLSALSGHIGLSKSNPITTILNISLKYFFKAICLPANRVVVLEEEFKKRLGKLTNEGKITVIPHGIDTNVSSTKKDLRKKLGIRKDEFVILYFGYLTWYKGIDFLVDSLKNVNSIGGRKIKVLVAGGPSFTQNEKSHYKKFVNELYKNIKGAENIIYTGFVNEKDITPIFNTADLSVFPYRTFMSSSGPLSMSISHNKPFILSKNLGKLSNSKDFKSGVEEASLNKSGLIFDLTKKDLLKTIKGAMRREKKEKLVKLSRSLNNKRSFRTLAVAYDKLIPQVNESRGAIALPALLVNKVKAYIL